MYRDGSDSARARSARIRASHDYEATELESMRQRTLAGDRPEARVPRIAHLGATLRRLLRPHEGPAGVLAVDVETDPVTRGLAE
jgi:hypothetical protein